MNSDLSLPAVNRRGFPVVRVNRIKTCIVHYRDQHTDVSRAKNWTSRTAKIDTWLSRKQPLAGFYQKRKLIAALSVRSFFAMPIPVQTRSEQEPSTPSGLSPCC